MTLSYQEWGRRLSGYRSSKQRQCESHPRFTVALDLCPHVLFNTDPYIPRQGSGIGIEWFLTVALRL